MQTQIRLFVQEKADQNLHCLLFHLYFRYIIMALSMPYFSILRPVKELISASQYSVFYSEKNVDGIPCWNIASFCRFSWHHTFLFRVYWPAYILRLCPFLGNCIHYVLDGKAARNFVSRKLIKTEIC